MKKIGLICLWLFIVSMIIIVVESMYFPWLIAWVVSFTLTTRALTNLILLKK